jgi:hypothetical protein
MRPRQRIRAAPSHATAPVTPADAAGATPAGSRVVSATCISWRTLARLELHRTREKLTPVNTSERSSPPAGPACWRRKRRRLVFGGRHRPIIGHASVHRAAGCNLIIQRPSRCVAPNNQPASGSGGGGAGAGGSAAVQERSTTLSPQDAPACPHGRKRERHRRGPAGPWRSRHREMVRQDRLGFRPGRGLGPGSAAGDRTAGGCRRPWLVSALRAVTPAGPWPAVGRIASRSVAARSSL